MPQTSPTRCRSTPSRRLAATGRRAVAAHGEEAVDRPGFEPDPGGGDAARALRRRRVHRAGRRRRGRPVAAHALPVLREQGRPAPRRVRGGDAHVQPDDPRRHRRPGRPARSPGRRHDRRGSHARVQRDRRRPRAGAAAAQARRGETGARRPLAGTGDRAVAGSRRRRRPRHAGPRERARRGDLHGLRAEVDVHHQPDARQRPRRRLPTVETLTSFCLAGLGASLDEGWFDPINAELRLPARPITLDKAKTREPPKAPSTASAATSAAWQRICTSSAGSPLPSGESHAFTICMSDFAP